MSRTAIALCTFLLLFLHTQAQQIDTATAKILREKYRAGKLAIRQDQLLKDIRYTSQQAKLALNKLPDTADLTDYISDIHTNLAIIDEGVFVNVGPVQTRRNLDVTSSVLEELLQNTTNRRGKIEKFNASLTGFIDRIDSLSADSALYSFSVDSIATANYLQHVALIEKELAPVDTALHIATRRLQELQTELDFTIFSINSRLDEIEKLHNRIESNTFSKDLAYPWEKPLPHKSSSEIIDISLSKEKLALNFYAQERVPKLVILAILVMIASYFLYSLKQKMADQNSVNPNKFGNLVLQRPIVSSFITVLTIFQFIFIQPPYIFGFCTWLVTAVLMARLISGYVTAFWLRFWIVLILLFTLSGMLNMILEISPLERWFTLLLSLCGVVYGLYILRHKKRTELKEKKILYFITFLMVLESIAVILNILGRYNLAKTTMVVGYAGAIIAIEFLWTVRLINATLGVVSGIYKHPDRKLFYIDFDRIGDKVPRFFDVFIVVGWFLLISRNFYGFRRMTEPFMEFLNTERTLGSFTFTIYSLFIFLVIIVTSTIISQVISFFAGEPGDQRLKDKQARTPGLGSWLLLVRIFILTTGVFLAFAATGIPLDKLAILLGALGVGIGLGLQGLISNLVSGLIIAFEKPVNVGDIIEVNGKLGTMQSIGFRSSVVKLVEGACLIVPNSDLLSNHLVNWTMGRNRRRINIGVNVSYGSNLKQVKEILEKILKENQQVVQYPEPIVSARAFEESSVAFDLYFWIGNIKDFLQIKSEIISEIHDAFTREGIVIPFPQQDLHIVTDLRAGGQKDNT